MTGTDRRPRAYLARIADEADCAMAELVCSAGEKAMRHRNRNAPPRRARIAARACVAVVAVTALAVAARTA